MQANVADAKRPPAVLACAADRRSPLSIIGLVLLICLLWRGDRPGWVRFRERVPQRPTWRTEP